MKFPFRALGLVWGIVPSAPQLERDFPSLVNDAACEARLRDKLTRWGGG